MRHTRSARGLFRALLFTTALLTAARTSAQTDCDPDEALNQVAVRFLEGKEKIPGKFDLVDTLGQTFHVSKSGELWKQQRSPAIKGKQSIKAKLDVSGYKVVSAGGSNEKLGNGCWAVFNFKARKTSAYVEVSPTPPSPFRYRKNGTDEVPASPKKGKGWNVVGKLLEGDSVELKVYETSDTGPDIYLFRIDFDWDFKGIKIDDVVKRVLEEREVFRFGLQTELPSEIDPASDPYVKFAKMTDGPAKDLVRDYLKDHLKLRRLEILDRTEMP
ncbi:MAG TPA: hypothetical protein VN851_17205 [Thermoanaerobaculia bacterium]|nr:hypothetical protein [Thermoanaerobaculia bacterium]